MNAISSNIYNRSKSKTKPNQNQTLWSKYLAYAENQKDLTIFWYMKVIIWFPCAFMVLAIYAMAMLTSSYIWFVGLSMLLFFANVIVHIAGAKSSFYIPLYHISTAIMVLIPMVTYFIVS